MSIQEILLLDFAELRWLVISCPDCHTEVSIDAQETATAIPAQCPSCHRHYDGTLTRNLDIYRQLYGSAKWKVRIVKPPERAAS
jgi:hypothetical protein